jgi:hypothetical protein
MVFKMSTFKLGAHFSKNEWLGVVNQFYDARDLATLKITGIKSRWREFPRGGHSLLFHALYGLFKCTLIM